MIDNFVLALTHSLMILAAWRLVSRPDLDDENAGSEPLPSGWAKLRRRKEKDPPRA